MAFKPEKSKRNNGMDQVFLFFFLNHLWHVCLLDAKICRSGFGCCKLLFKRKHEMLQEWGSKLIFWGPNATIGSIASRNKRFIGTKGAKLFKQFQKRAIKTHLQANRLRTHPSAPVLLSRLLPGRVVRNKTRISRSPSPLFRSNRLWLEYCNSFSLRCVSP